METFVMENLNSINTEFQFIRLDLIRRNQIILVYDINLFVNFKRCIILECISRYGHLASLTKVCWTFPLIFLQLLKKIQMIQDLLNFSLG